MPAPWRYNLDRKPRRVRNQEIKDSMDAIRAILKPMPKETMNDKMNCLRLYHMMLQAYREGVRFYNPEKG